MPKFRKKPVVVDAEQYNGPVSIRPKPGTAIPPDDAPPLPSGVEWDVFDTTFELYPTIKTLNGRVLITPGEWIITGIKGEKYPCKPDIFADTYEPLA